MKNDFYGYLNFESRINFIKPKRTSVNANMLCTYYTAMIRNMPVQRFFGSYTDMSGVVVYDAYVNKSGQHCLRALNTSYPSIHASKYLHCTLFPYDNPVTNQIWCIWNNLDRENQNGLLATSDEMFENRNS